MLLMEHWEGVLLLTFCSEIEHHVESSDKRAAFFFLTAGDINFLTICYYYITTLKFLLLKNIKICSSILKNSHCLFIGAEKEKLILHT